MTEGNLIHTFQSLGSVLRLQAECRHEIATRGPDWGDALDALALMDDLNEHAARLIARCGLANDAGAPPERGSPGWRRPLPLAA